MLGTHRKSGRFALIFRQDDTQELAQRGCKQEIVLDVKMRSRREETKWLELAITSA
jgi:hypothetical protein